MKVRHYYKPLVITGILVVTLWGMSGITLIALYGTMPDSPGTFGDMFGAINALFSGLAFAGLIYTILQQREELDLTRQEFIKQNETFRLQRFENTFFQLLRLNDDLLDGQTITSQQESVETRVYLYMISEQITQAINKQLESLQQQADSSTSHQPLGEEQKRMIVKQTLQLYNKEIETSLLHYFNNLFSVLQFVDASSLIGQEEKVVYINILKTQMSVSEKNILFFMLMAWDGMKKQKQLYDQYQFLNPFAAIAYQGTFEIVYKNS